MIFFNKNVMKYIKVLVLKGDGNVPESIMGNCQITRDSDGYYWNGTAFVNYYYPFDVTHVGYYNLTNGCYYFPFTPPDYGQYTFSIVLSSPHFVGVIDIEVERIQLYESEDVS